MSTSVRGQAVTAARQSLSLEQLLVPGDARWNDAAEVRVKLEPTPLDRQPSAYVQKVYGDRRRARVSEIRVRAIASDDEIAVRLEWNAAKPHPSIADINVYPDACAMLFPANGEEADLSTMGSEDKPVAVWHWRAGTAQPFAVSAQGIGTAQRKADHGIRVGSNWENGTWQIVLAGPMDATGLPAGHGDTIPVAFAVWSGAGEDRAGVKSHSPVFHRLEIG